MVREAGVSTVWKMPLGLSTGDSRCIYLNPLPCVTKPLIRIILSQTNLVDLMGSGTFFLSSQRSSQQHTFTQLIFYPRRHYYRINPKWVWVSRIYSWCGWVQL
jgi:hypothetical protein